MKLLTISVVTFLLSQISAMAYQLELLVDELSSPIEFVQPDPGEIRYFVAEQSGIVHIVADGVRHSDPLMDLRPNMIKLEEGFEERGLLGFALHPQFSNNGRLYVSYSAPLASSAPTGWNYTRIISEFTLDRENPDRVDMSTERVLIALDWPSRKHNGGALSFGPDGHLYIGIGDGGGAHGVGKKVIWSAFEVPENQLYWDRLAQDVTSLFGSILRIDVEKGFPKYGSPLSNPFVGREGRDEVFVWGVRNPYRVAFDSDGSGKFLVTAVGETLWESAFLLTGAGNMGWPIKEGSHCINRANPRDPPKNNSCQSTDTHGFPLLDPVIEYPNMQVMHPETRYNAVGIGTAIVGARFYRGNSFPRLKGKIVFADWSANFRKPSGQLFSASGPGKPNHPWSFMKMKEFSTRIVSLAEDGNQELIILTNDEIGPFGTSGKVYRLVP